MALLITSCKQVVREMDLSGEWEVALDSLDKGISEKWYMESFPDKITLPGTLCDAGYGTPCTLEPTMDKEIFLNLKRKFDYLGPAWYKKECFIPAEWNEKDVLLTLERVIWNSQVWINGTKVEGFNESLTTPHYFNLSKYLVPGENNKIVIRIDNRRQHDISVKNLAHAYTNDTQTMWNGILGKIALTAKDKVQIEELRLTPDIDNQTVNVSVKIGSNGSSPVSGKLLFAVKDPKGNKLADKEVQVNNTEITFTYPINNPMLWDEFTPNIYEATATLETEGMTDSKCEIFGMRKLTNQNALLQINNRRLFLRGTLECCIFPLNGYPPMDEAGWEKVFSTARDYGMNHLRFHSWCPPEAAFNVADRMGFYLQVELPLWTLNVGEDKGTVDFLYTEAAHIMKEYGNHPSFVLYCNGNEITGNFDFIEELTHYGRVSDKRRLFSGSTARTRVKSDQFYITHQTPKGHMAIYEGRPYTDWDKNKELGIDVPVISHESGQRCIYPNFKEIPNFTGPVQARNFEVFRESLAANGMLDQADDFFRVSGAQTVLEYKDVIEAELRTSLKSGFQLLALNDFTGQGYAPVGILDPFWESKGLITPEKFREFCAPTVALLRFPKRAYYCDETFEGKAEVYNYSPSILKSAKAKWWITDASGRVLKSGRLKTQRIGNYGVFPLGTFQYMLNSVTAPQKLTIHLSVGDKVHNSWDIWVYPHHKDLMQTTPDVLYTTTYDAKAKQYLQEGKKVVLCPKPNKVKGRKSVFHNHFWNPIMFKWAPTTLGCLIHADQPMFADFITEKHLDWQWWDILTNAKVIDMTDTPQELRPFIQVIDSYETNQKLGIGFEARVNNGKLLVLAVDTRKDLDKRPATQQLLKSIDQYVKSGQFAPRATVKEEFIQSFLIK